MGGFILLGINHGFGKTYLREMVLIFEAIIGNVKDPGTFMAMKVLALFMQAYPEQGQALQALLSKIISLIAVGKESTLAVVHYLFVFSRLLLHSREFAIEFFSRSTDNCFPALLDLWTDHVEV